MTEMTSPWIFGAVMYAYLGVTVVYLIYAITQSQRIGLVATVSLLLVLGVHTVGLVFRWIETHQTGYGYVPLSNMYESLVFFSWTIVLLYIVLEILYKLDLFLREISGMDQFSLQPASGSQAILAMASIVQAYHATRGESEQRDEMITTIFSHPSDAAAAGVKNYKVITIYQDEDGLPDLDEAGMERAMESLAREAEGVSEDDPRSMARLMRRFYESTGMPLGDGMEEAMRRMEAGEDPDQIEEELGDLLEDEAALFEGKRASLKGLRRRMRPPEVDDTLYEL